MHTTPVADASSLADTLLSQITRIPEISSFDIIGIQRGGMLLARWIHQQLQHNTRLGSLNISFHRDDFVQSGLPLTHPIVGPSHIPFSLDNARILLVDDVFMTGRTLRAALNEIFDFGRPHCVRFACLVSLGMHELPLQPDITAAHLTLDSNERIQLDQKPGGNFVLSRYRLTSEHLNERHNTT